MCDPLRSETTGRNIASFLGPLGNNNNTPNGFHKRRLMLTD